jgi:putative oxidoreductase
MAEVIGRFASQAFALLRIVSGLMFMIHGTQKIVGWPPGKMPHPLPMMLVVGGWIELVGGFLILIGLFTGIAAFLCSGEMAVAYWMGHVARNHGELNPLVNQGELAALYCFVFLYIAAHGAGIWSIDNVLRRRTPVTASTAATHV